MKAQRKPVKKLLKSITNHLSSELWTDRHLSEIPMFMSCKCDLATEEEVSCRKTHNVFTAFLTEM